MLGWIIVIAAILGLAGIYYTRLEDTKKKDRLKIHLDSAEPVNKGKSKPDPNSWKRKSLDYKTIHEAYNKADLFYSKGDLENAQKSFIYVLSLHPDHIEANNKLGLIYLKKNIPNKAEAIFKHLIDLDAKNPLFYSNLALAYYNQNMLFEAKQAYEASLKLEPKKVNRLINLGQVCVDLKDYKAAINAYSKAVEIQPKEIELYFIVVELLLKVKAYEEAIAFMEALLESQPYNAKAKEIIREVKMLKGSSPLTNNSPAKPSTGTKTPKQRLF